MRPASIGAAVEASSPVSNACCAFTAWLEMAASPDVNAAGGFAPAYFAIAARDVSMPSKSDVSSLSISPGIVESIS